MSRSKADSFEGLAICTPFGEPSTVFEELEACIEAPRVDTAFVEKEDKQPTESKAGFNIEVADTKESEAYRLTTVFVTQSLAKHMEAAQNKGVIKSHGSTVFQPLEPVETRKDCTFDFEECQYSVSLDQLAHCTRS